MRLIVSPVAARGLAALPERDRRALFARVEAFAAAPFATYPAARPLRGHENRIRVRQGDWRAVCRIDRAADTVTLERVEHRREDISVSENPDTVILTRAEYEALIERIEDAEDNAVLDAVEARERAIGKEKARADHLPAELVRRLIDGEHPVRVWRAHRHLSRDALAAAAGIAPSYLSEIETRRKPGSFGALAKLAAALGISLDDLAAWLDPRQG